MSLIEQLGGYKKAKGVYKSVDHLRETKTITMSNISVEFDVGVLRCELLQYRRENNIFEVGDYVVYKSNAGLEGLFQIETMTKTGKPKTVKTKRFGNFPCRYCEVRHATQKEIQAGRRL